ncbi:MAG: DUF1893 domain-containing protein [Clostridia bacterium]|nr:DUF1893 domain-containing protein [Clostridia bacterium]
MQENAAIALLKNEGYTLLLYNETEIITERARGVAPLVSLLDGKKNCASFSAVDKVVGKAAAFLYILLGIRRVFALTVSESALALLQGYGIAVGYEVCVPRIKNREGTGFCPMESAVFAEKDPSSALRAIRAALAALRSRQK